MFCRDFKTYDIKLGKELMGYSCRSIQLVCDRKSLGNLTFVNFLKHLEKFLKRKGF